MSIDPAAILVSAGLAGAAAIGVTIAIERFGGRVGGLLGTLPTTIVPAAAGIAAGAANPDEFSAAMAVAPAGMLLNVLFLWLWRVIPPRLPAWSSGRRLAAMLLISLAAWILAAALVVQGAAALRSSGRPLEPLGWLITFGIALIGALACWKSPPSLRGRRPVGPVTLLSRGVLAALAIGIAVWLASVGGAVAAGVAAVFPAIFLTTMAALWLAQGEAVQAGAVGPMMLGSTSVAVYAMLAVRFLPTFGTGLGSLLSWLMAAMLATLPAWWLTGWLAARDGKAPSPEASGVL
jgi:hypothetical protein